MDLEQLTEIATVVTKLKMYPYFDVANFILMCTIVREDSHPQTTGAHQFSRKHPLSCWVSSMLLCFGGGILGNLLAGEPLITPYQDHQALLTATLVWYLIFYSPVDVVYRLTKLLPFKIIIYCLKEVQRVNKINHGVAWALNKFPTSYFVVVVFGVIKGAASSFLRPVAKLICGVWTPASNECLKPSFVTKGSLIAAVVFILERKGIIEAPHVLVYLAVVVFFVYFRLMSLLLSIHDPFVPLENLFSAIFLGGMWDALNKAVVKEKPPEKTNDLRSTHLKNSEDKKKD